MPSQTVRALRCLSSYVAHDNNIRQHRKDNEMLRNIDDPRLVASEVEEPGMEVCVDGLYVGSSKGIWSTKYIPIRLLLWRVGHRRYKDHV